MLTPSQIRELRENSGLSQSKFAQLFGVSPATIGHWETGERIPPQIYVANMMQLRQRIERMQNREEITNILLGFSLVGGLIAFLIWLFRDDN